MLSRSERILENIPVGSLGIIPLLGCEELGNKVNDYLVKWRRESAHEHKNDVAFSGYEKENYLINASVPRFGSGEAKGILGESVRGKDIYLMVDVCNYNVTYSLTGNTNHMSPDDHFQDLKRIIAAVGGKARRINVIMPFLYESRQHKRTGRESLDCALALNELVRMGVDNIITFDAHDPRVQNAIPLKGFETVQPVYQFIKYLLGTILAAYKDFGDRFAIVEEKLPAIDIVRKATLNKIGRFTKQDIRELCPSLSMSSVEGALRKMVAAGELKREGVGKSTCYIRLK